MKSKHLWALLLILIIASFLRLYHITTIPPGLYPDEAMNGNNALQTLRSGDFKVFYPENNGREGLFINIQALFLKFFGVNEPWVLRLPSAIFGVLTVLGLYFLGRELFSENVGLLSAFLLATSFWHINFSRIGFRAIMAPFLLTWALYLFIKAFKNEDTTAVQPWYLLPLLRPSDGVRDKNAICYMPYAICAGILYGLGFYTYIAYRVTPVLILFILLFFWLESKKENWRKKFYAVASVFLVFAFLTTVPLAAYFLAHKADFLGRTSQISVFSSETPLKDLGTNTLKTLGMFNIRGDSNWRHNYSGRPELFWPVGVLFILGIAIAIKSIISKIFWGHFSDFIKNSYFAAKTNFGFLILFLWFILAMLPVVISNEGLPHALRSILMIPPVFMFAGVGGVVAYNFLKRYSTSFWLPLVSTIFLLLLVFEAYNTYFSLWAKNPNVSGAFSADYAELGRTLNALPANVPKYVVVKTGGVFVNGIPMPAQTVMFITDTYSTENQKTKNIYYLLPNQENTVPSEAKKFYIK